MTYPFTKHWEFSNTFGTAQHYDFKCPVWTPFVAIEAFMPDFIGIDKGRGIAGTGEHGRWRYWHVESFDIQIQENKLVKEGQMIGYTGGWPPLANEATTGAHLHVDCQKDGKYIDFMKLIKEEEDMSDPQWIIDVTEKGKKALKNLGLTEWLNKPPSEQLKFLIDLAVQGQEIGLKEAWKKIGKMIGIK